MHAILLNKATKPIVNKPVNRISKRKLLLSKPPTSWDKYVMKLHVKRKKIKKIISSSAHV